MKRALMAMSNPVKSRAAVLVCFLAGWGAACTPAEPPDNTVPTLFGTVDLEIGAETGEAPYLFGRVSGLAADAEGRIFVADAQADEIRVFDRDGVFQYAFGGAGQGPGELGNPCCLSFGPGGLLWVRDVGNSRYQGFDVRGGRHEYQASVPMRQRAPGLYAPLDFDEQGNLIDIGARPDPDTELSLTVRLHLSATGDIVSQETFAEPDPGDAMHTVDRGTSVNQVRMFLWQPFGARPLTAHGPDRWAVALSSRYSVRLFRSGSDPLDIVRDPGPGIPLSAGERERAEDFLALQLRGTGVARNQLPFDIPDTKAPLQRLFFDRERNLWVELTVPDSADREADVFDPDGRYVGRRVWPAGVDLGVVGGWVSGNTALGRLTDENDVAKVVRIRFSDQGEDR